MQVDTLGKKLLVGIAFAYLGIVLFIPAINVFYQVPDFLKVIQNRSLELLCNE